MSSPPGRRWLVPVLVYALILALSAVPGESLSGTPGWTAVTGHAGGYALLAWSIHRAWDGRGAGLVAVVLALALGVVNEVQQGFVPGRAPDVADLGVDGLGALAGVLVAVARRSVRRRPRRAARPPARGSAARR